MKGYLGTDSLYLVIAAGHKGLQYQALSVTPEASDVKSSIYWISEEWYNFSNIHDSYYIQVDEDVYRADLGHL